MLAKELLSTTKPLNCIFIHQTWALPGINEYKYPNVSYSESWKTHNKDCVHVLWNDEDNHELIDKYYPEYRDFFAKLPLFIHKLDFVRLLYLHKYGGIYADMDFECKTNISQYITDVCIVESPLCMETVQNSLMGCNRAGHPFWLKVIEQIIHSFSKIWYCKYGDPGYGGEQFFHRRLTRHIAFSAFTSTLSGPGALDRTLARENWNIIRLNSEFYRGKHAYHHEKASWLSILRITSFIS